MVSDCDCPAVCAGEPTMANLAAGPAAIVTAPDVPNGPEREVAVNVPVAALPVYVSRPPRVAMPLTKSPAASRTSPPESPETMPANGASAATVTGFAKALNEVIVLPYASCAVSVFEPVNAAPFVCALARWKASFEKDAGETATASASPPVVVIVVDPLPPSAAVAVTVAFSAA